MIRYIIYTVAILFAISCSKESSPITSQEEVRNVAFSMMTEAGDKPRSYCFALYTTNQNIRPQYGFYTSDIINNSVDKKYSWLTPTVESGNLGLAASIGTYSMLAVSPAVAPTYAESYWGLDLKTNSKIEEITKTIIYGYPYNRVPKANKDYDQLFIGDPRSIYIKGVLASTAPDKNTYNYTFDEGYTLKQQRTKFQLRARTGSVTNKTGQTTQLSYDISSIYISDVVNLALFNPIVGYYATEKDDLYPFTNFQNDGNYSLINWAESTALVVEEGENIDDENYFYLISADYSNQEKYPITPTLNIEFKNSSGSIRTVPITLDIDFKPQHYYTFDLLISSVNITLSITVEDWDKHDVTDEVIDDIDDRTITVSIEDNNWESGGTITGDIDDIIYND